MTTATLQAAPAPCPPGPNDHCDMCGVGVVDPLALDKRARWVAYAQVRAWFLVDGVPMPIDFCGSHFATLSEAVKARATMILDARIG